MGHVSRSLVLSGANKPLSARRLVSLLSTSSKLEIDFCLELKGLRPFQCLSSVCVCACVRVSACVHVCARRCMCTCLWPLSVCRWVWICVSLYVFADAISVIEFRFFFFFFFAARGCPSVKGDFCPPNAAPWLSGPMLMATCANKKRINKRLLQSSGGGGGASPSSRMNGETVTA